LPVPPVGSADGRNENDPAIGRNGIDRRAGSAQMQKRMAGVFLIGLTAGLFGGLVGLGGGVLMVPLLAGMARLDQHEAHGTSLFALVFTGIAGAGTYALHQSLNIPAALLLAGGAVWPARLGAKYCTALPDHKLKRYFGFFLFFIAVLMVSKPYLPTASHPNGGLFQAALLLATGAVTGFCSGLMGIGGGAIMIAGMVLLAGFDQYTAQGSSLLAMVPAGFVGAVTHWRLGNVNRRILPMIIPGVMIGTFAGGWSAHLLAEPTLKAIFAAILIGTGIREIKTATRPCP